MPASPVRLGLEQARRFHRRAAGLDAPLAGIREALARHGYVQIDPLNVCGRMHDLILRNRVAGYAEGDFIRFLHDGDGETAPSSADSPRARGGFEQFSSDTGVLVGFPFEAWSYLQPKLAERRRRARGYYSRLSAAEERLAQRILEDLRARGPLSSDDIEHDAKSVTAWGTRGRQAKTVLEKLFAHGRVLISERRGFRRIYDLPERVLPPAVQAAPPADAQAALRWSVHTKLRQRRLVALRREELPLVEDLVTEVVIEDGPKLHCLTEDLPLFTANGDGAARETLLLAPLDPLIYDRRVTSRLWDFDYTWEVYTPAAKRVRGYYALPVLHGLALVGHVEPRFDRDRRRIAVLSRRIRRGTTTASAVKDLERFLRTDRR